MLSRGVLMKQDNHSKPSLIIQLILVYYHLKFIEFATTSLRDNLHFALTHSLALVQFLFMTGILLLFLYFSIRKTIEYIKRQKR